MSARSAGFFGIEVKADEQFLDGFGAHSGFEVLAVLFAEFAIFFFGEEIKLLDAGGLGLAGIYYDVFLEVDGLLEAADFDVEQVAQA